MVMVTNFAYRIQLKTEEATVFHTVAFFCKRW